MQIVTKTALSIAWSSSATEWRCRILKWRDGRLYHLVLGRGVVNSHFWILDIPKLETNIAGIKLGLFLWCSTDSIYFWVFFLSTQEPMEMGHQLWSCPCSTDWSGTVQLRTHLYLSSTVLSSHPGSPYYTVKLSGGPGAGLFQPSALHSGFSTFLFSLLVSSWFVRVFFPVFCTCFVPFSGQFNITLVLCPA